MVKNLNIILGPKMGLEIKNYKFSNQNWEK